MSASFRQTSTLTQFVDIHGCDQRRGRYYDGTSLALLALLGFLLVILGKRNVKGNVLLGIVITAVLYYVFSRYCAILRYHTDRTVL